MSETNTTKFKALKPAAEVLNQLPVRDSWQLNYVIAGNIAFICTFILLGAVLFYQAMPLVGSLSIVSSLCFLISLILIKKGRIYTGDYVTTVGILIDVFIILFFAGDSDSALLFYRNACFIIVMGICNELISLKNKQIHIFGITSGIMWVISCVTIFAPHFKSNPTGTISGIAICSLAMILTQLIVILLSRFNAIIIQKAEAAKGEAEEHLGAITRVIDESKNGLEVGKRLYDATQDATQSIVELNNIYSEISTDSTGLSTQAVTLKDSSAQVKNQAEKMKESVVQQNNSITETSTAMSELSENLSAMSEIADKKHADMNQVLNSLDGQMALVKKLVGEVKRVEESSKGIAAFVQTVNKIASQTGLLAMNASIESAHAGETGKGFSVIAQEIRKLSEQTNHNADQIATELEKNAEVVKNATESVAGFEKFTQDTTTELRSTINGLEEILAGITDMNKATQDVMNALQEIVEQTHSTNQIVDNVVQEFELQDSALEKISSFAQQLQDRVSGMDDQLKNIEGIVNGIEKESMENVSVTQKITGTLNFN